MRWASQLRHGSLIVTPCHYDNQTRAHIGNSILRYLLGSVGFQHQSIPTKLNWFKCCRRNMAERNSFSVSHACEDKAMRPSRSVKILSTCRDIARCMALIATTWQSDARSSCGACSDPQNILEPLPWTEGIKNTKASNMLEHITVQYICVYICWYMYYTCSYYIIP